MSMQDPYNNDGLKPRTDFDAVRDRDPGNAWTWIAGAAVIVAIVLALTFGSGNNEQASAPSASPTTTTGQTTGQTPSPAPSENTGQQPRTPAPANQ